MGDVLEVSKLPRKTQGSLVIDASMMTATPIFHLSSGEVVLKTVRDTHFHSIHALLEWDSKLSLGNASIKNLGVTTCETSRLDHFNVKKMEATCLDESRIAHFLVTDAIKVRAPSPIVLDGIKSHFINGKIQRGAKRDIQGDVDLEVVD